MKIISRRFVDVADEPPVEMLYLERKRHHHMLCPASKVACYQQSEQLQRILDSTIQA